MVNPLQSFGIIFIGTPKLLRSTLSLYLSETIKYPLVSSGSLLKLDQLLRDSVMPFIFDGTPKSQDQLSTFCNWIKKNSSKNMDIVELRGDHGVKGLTQKAISAFKRLGVRHHVISNLGSLESVTKKTFLTLSPYIFQEAGMAEGYYSLRSVCNPKDEGHIFISGMPTFVYGGRVLMKDFDILVPDDKIDAIAQTIGTPVKVKDSSVAYTRSTYIGDSVECLSNLAVYAGKRKIPFKFDFLWEEMRFVRFMGLRTPIMGVEDLIIFKASLSRVGIDDFGRHKDDLSDVEGLIGRQQIDWKKLKSRADRLGVTKHLESKLKMLNIRFDSIAEVW